MIAKALLLLFNRTIGSFSLSHRLTVCYHRDMYMKNINKIEIAYVLHMDEWGYNEWISDSSVILLQS